MQHFKSAGLCRFTLAPLCHCLVWCLMSFTSRLIYAWIGKSLLRVVSKYVDFTSNMVGIHCMYISHSSRFVCRQAELLLFHYVKNIFQDPIFRCGMHQCFVIHLIVPVKTCRVLVCTENSGADVHLIVFVNNIIIAA
uniref:Putative secreted protein ovary overexpressed n=1 Tax=Rhipicephalus microplus TaxID=6941 RepID=A0A6M2D910_RHIMP